MVSNSVFNFIKLSLDEANVCRRCILRFLGCREYKNYISKFEVEKVIDELIQNELKEGSIAEQEIKIDDDIPHIKRLSPNPCALCLGILQGACEETIPQINNEVIREKHKFTDFVLQVSLPVVIDLREKLFLMYIKEKLSKPYPVPENEIPSVKDICKWIIGSQFGSLFNIEFTPFSNFQILISSYYPDTVEDCLVLYKKSPSSFPNARKKNARADVYTRAAVLKAMDNLSSDIRELYELPPMPPNKSCTFSEIKCMHSPLHLGGRYNKYSRELSQTPWILDGERKMESSVNELITDIVEKKIQADKIIFSASGREDVDVKMLGNGRPFLLELLNPRCMEWSSEELKTIENEINESTNAISVNNLRIISKDEILLLKEGEEHKKKTYNALCVVKRDLLEEDAKMLSDLKDVTLYQKTPLRVLHRRSLSVREKLLHSIEATILSEHLLRLTLVTQAGTYVKEFVHGDFGRTNPNLGSLLNTEADILELDVTDIDLDWPPNAKS